MTTDVMQQQDVKSFEDVFIGLWRRKGRMLLVMLTVLLATAALALGLPPIYRSQATILIEQQEMPPELVALALPVQPLCREDCAGLCPRCGADRNRESCRCREIESESPFAVLSKLRKGRGEGES